MKVYIITESRAATDLYDMAEDYTNVVAVYAKREDAAKCVSNCVKETKKEFAMRPGDRKTKVFRWANRSATIDVYDDDDLAYSFDFRIHEMEVK